MVDPISFRRRGLLFVLSSPSGAGKSTIARMLLEADPGIALSVSATTRPIRPGEVDGRDYVFVDDAGFDRLVAEGAFLEWAHVFGRRYGTLRTEVARQMEAGRDVLLDIDWQGTQQLKQVDPDIVRVFVLPPSTEELERRLRARGTDRAEGIARRIAPAQAEIDHTEGYECIIVNEDVETCFAKVVQTLGAERTRRPRHAGLIGFVRQLVGPQA